MPLNRLPRHAASRHADHVALALLTALLLPLYLATMYPDVVGTGDTAKFQYLGAVLGTAHPPGYPTYVMLSHVWSLLPMNPWRGG